MCLHHKECITFVELMEHLAMPNCMASSLITMFCRAMHDARIGHDDDGSDFDIRRDTLQQLSNAPDSQLDEFYRKQAKRLLDALPAGVQP